MNNRPCGNELLTIARRTLLNDLLPLLPASKTYDVLMVANAMAVAARELEPHVSEDAHAAREIAAFYNEIGVASTEPTEADLAARIRARLIPVEFEKRTTELLNSLTKAKLVLSNPKYLI